MARETYITDEKIEKDADGTIYIVHTEITNTPVTLAWVQAEITRIQNEKSNIAQNFNKQLNRLQRLLNLVQNA